MQRDSTQSSGPQPLWRSSRCSRSAQVFCALTKPSTLSRATRVLCAFIGAKRRPLTAIAAKGTRPQPAPVPFATAQNSKLRQFCMIPFATASVPYATLEGVECRLTPGAKHRSSRDAGLAMNLRAAEELEEGIQAFAGRNSEADEDQPLVSSQAERGVLVLYRVGVFQQQRLSLDADRGCVW